MWGKKKKDFEQQVEEEKVRIRELKDEQLDQYLKNMHEKILRAFKPGKDLEVMIAAFSDVIQDDFSQMLFRTFTKSEERKIN